MKKLVFATFLTLLITFAFSQKQMQDKAQMKDYESGYYENSILKGIESYEKTTETPTNYKQFKKDNRGENFPNDIDLYKKEWFNPPISQGNTGTCWCFSTTSYFESEVYRLTKQKVKLSEMYTVYWEYVEKAKRYVKERGNSLFDEGSEANAVMRIWKTYGVVPFSDYSGLINGKTVYDHSKMAEEMTDYLKSVKASNAWNEELIITTIKSILNSYMGAPPTKIKVNGIEMSPQEYLKNSIKINTEDYIDVLSLLEKPYYQKVDLPVPDNWWISKDYYNVNLDEYMTILKKAIRAGYTMCIGGDVSEAGFDPNTQTATIPTFDIPSAYIDENARQMRFSNKTTTDDHGLHLVGFVEKNGKDWFLIKDSGAGSRNAGKENKNFGFYFFSEDYIKLKMLDFTVHKDVFKDYFQKFK